MELDDSSASSGQSDFEGAVDVTTDGVNDQANVNKIPMSFNNYSCGIIMITKLII